jgi:hypothetical protein
MIQYEAKIAFFVEKYEKGDLVNNHNEVHSSVKALDMGAGN